jgi:hypothetical protein
MTGATVTVPLSAIAHARSGDKGAHANVGVWTGDPAVYDFLREALTTARVARHLGELVRGGVTRYELPQIRAFNFVLRDALEGGGTVSLRTDAQGKTLSLALGLLTLDVPEHLVPEHLLPQHVQPEHLQPGGRN